jgi:hypothetical protein
LGGTAFPQTRFSQESEFGGVGRRPHLEEFVILALRAVFVLLALAAVAVGFLLPTPGAGSDPAPQTSQIATLHLD